LKWNDSPLSISSYVQESDIRRCPNLITKFGCVSNADVYVARLTVSGIAQKTARRSRWNIYHAAAKPTEGFEGEIFPALSISAIASADMGWEK